ncbi:MAG: hypothetical protein ABJO52_04885 [Nisaea sp.]|uniref:hypothetical protein n=1 Tax=Nisaea sp. TaxID=2024842 RepID=UPI00329A4DAE
MSHYVICSSVLKNSTNDKTGRIYWNVLAPIVQDNKIRAIIDNGKNVAIREYYEAATTDNTGVISTWVQTLCNTMDINCREVDADIEGMEHPFPLLAKIADQEIKEPIALVLWKRSATEEKIAGPARVLDRTQAYWEISTMNEETKKPAIQITGNTDTTIIIESSLRNSINKIQSISDEETAKTLREMRRLISQTGNEETLAQFNEFNKEIEKQDPNPAKLQSFWDSIVKISPDLSKLASEIGKIISLFS